MEFSRQEYWSGLPLLPLGDLPNPRIQPTSPVSPVLQADSLPTGSPEKHRCLLVFAFITGNDHGAFW